VTIFGTVSSAKKRTMSYHIVSLHTVTTQDNLQAAADTYSMCFEKLTEKVMFIDVTNLQIKQ